MKTLTPHRKRLAGFSLVEMAIVILIAGIMMGAGLSLLSVKQEAAKWDATQKHQEAIKQALINYLGKNRRLPCPAANDSSTGLEVRPVAAPPLPPCNSYFGMVPYQTLGLDRAAALDGWENFITYVVSPSTIATPPNPQPTPPWTTAWLYTYISTAPTEPLLQTQTPFSAFWPSTSTGGITVTDGTLTIANPVTATGAAVVLVSHGKNGYGAYNVKANQNSLTPAGANEQTNASPVTGIPTPTITVFKRETTDSTTGGGSFDDIVMIMSAIDLTGPLIANGTLQSSAQAALSQANDIVMGTIVKSKWLCPDPNSSCVSPAYYYTIPTTPSAPAFPTSVMAWGVVYAQGATPIYVTSTSPPAASNAYTLTAGDGTIKTVLIDELRGILTRGAGFN